MHVFATMPSQGDAALRIFNAGALYDVVCRSTSLLPPLAYFDQGDCAVLSRVHVLALKRLLHACSCVQANESKAFAW